MLNFFYRRSVRTFQTEKITEMLAEMLVNKTVNRLLPFSYLHLDPLSLLVVTVPKDQDQIFTCCFSLVVCRIQYVVPLIL